MRRVILVILVGIAAAVGSAPGQQRVLLTDDFEQDLGKWELRGARGISIRPSGDSNHGNVLVLEPHGDDVLVLARGSARWGPVRIEADIRFPGETDSYLGVAYHYRRRGDREDFGLVYLKGNEDYLLPNPHRDRNVSRLLYDEYRTPLGEGATTSRGEWRRLRLEIVETEVHLYVGDVPTPQLTFSLYEGTSGAVGFQPRSVGAEVWIDNVTITTISALSYRGPPVPSVAYQPDSLLTDWEVLGPFDRTRDEIARNPNGARSRWRPFATDDRGAVITGRVVDFHGRQTVGYFRTRISATESGRAFLHVSTADDLALWVNGRFHWFIPRSGLAWFDFWRNPDHRGRRIPITLREGENDLVLRVRGGTYASGGYFARVEQ